MKNDISRNVTLSFDEKVVKHFKKLQAIGTNAQVMLTSKRLIIYTHGMALNRGKKVKQKMMNELDLKSIHRFEYYEEAKNFPLVVRFIGLLLFALASGLFYLNYLGSFHLPEYPYQMSYIDYGFYGIVAILGLLFMFKVRKTLSLRVRSGLQEVTTLRFTSNKYNELALRFLAGKIHTK